MHLPKPVRNWYEQFKKEGMPDKKAMKEAIQRAYEEGGISESQADRLERRAGSIKGPGIPDGTGPMRDSDECPYSDDEADEMSEKIARELVRVAEELIRDKNALAASKPPAKVMKEVRFIVDLMIDAGHAHRKGYLRSSSKNVPYGPSMRERGGTVWDWADGLTPKQASEVIDYLLSE